MARRIAVAIAWLMSGAIATVQAGEIGVYATPHCSGCTLTPTLGSIDTLYVAIQNDNNPPVGCGQPLCGASFRLTGLPSTWYLIEARPTPEAYFVYGDPIAPQGVALSIHCSSDPCILLYTIVVVIGPTEPDVHVRVGPGPGCYIFDHCPAIFTSDAPCDPTCQCYPGGEIILNPVSDNCTVAVASRNWSAFRVLYR